MKLNHCFVLLLATSTTLIQTSDKAEIVHKTMTLLDALKTETDNLKAQLSTEGELKSSVEKQQIKRLAGCTCKEAPQEAAYAKNVEQNFTVGISVELVVEPGGHKGIVDLGPRPRDMIIKDLYALVAKKIAQEDLTCKKCFSRSPQRMTPLAVVVFNKLHDKFTLREKHHGFSLDEEHQEYTLGFLFKAQNGITFCARGKEKKSST